MKLMTVHHYQVPITLVTLWKQWNWWQFIITRSPSRWWHCESNETDDSSSLPGPHHAGDTV